MSVAPGLRGVACNEQKRVSKCYHLTGKWFSLPFTLLQVTKSGSWPWLCSVRWQQFAHSHTFGLVSLGQPACAHTDTGSSISPGNGIGNKKELRLAPWCWLPAKVAGAGWPPACSLQAKGKETSATTQRGQEAGWVAEARKETTLPFSGGTCVLLCPALSCPLHLPLASPHLFPLPLPRSVEFRP